MKIRGISAIFAVCAVLYYPYNTILGDFMNYVKKMCILRQIKQGFSADGKALSGLIKVEQYGKNLAVEVSVINFAPLSSGEYYCLLSDGKGKTEMLLLRGKSMFNILTDMDLSGGFCGVICHVKNDVVPIAYGINGNGAYDWRAILSGALPPVFPKNDTPAPAPEIAKSVAPPPSRSAPSLPRENGYDDETVATENYYEEKNYERQQYEQACENAHAQSAAQNAREEEGANAAAYGNSPRLLHPFKTNPDGYYLSVKSEIDDLFKRYPRDKTLCGAFSCSEWVRVKGTAKEPQYLVGVLYDDGRARYICYALSATSKDNPPEEIKNTCSFVPVSALDNANGFFVIFQSAASGECIKPEQA